MDHAPRRMQYVLFATGCIAGTALLAPSAVLDLSGAGNLAHVRTASTQRVRDFGGIEPLVGGVREQVSLGARGQHS